ncbi:MAG: hypothetical protein QM779_13905 [Propionicimonas sp.]|uniref:hypothetical protein n=1 Tax=Propionicimonas sp. TaxID=1955623 RepID=UPI003D0B690C
MSRVHLSEHIIARTEHVARAVALIEDSGAAAMLDGWRSDDKRSSGRTGKGGMPAWLDDAAVLALLYTVTSASRPQTVNAMASLVYHGLEREALLLLGVDPSGMGPRDVRERVSRSLHRLLDVLDPHPGTKKERKLVTEQREYEESLDRTVEAERLQRLHELSNAIVMASVRLLPSTYLARWNGNCSVDSTFVPAYTSAGNPRREDADGSRVVSIEPFAGWYVRDSFDHGLTPEMLAAKDAKTKWMVREAKWGWEATTILMGMEDPQREPTYPLLCLGMSFHKPGFEPGPNAVRALRLVRSAGMPAGYLVGDRAYGYSPLLEHFAGPARELGYKLVWELKDEDLGKAQMVNGAVLLEGNLYCPAIMRNSGLVNATRSHRVGDPATKEKTTFGDWKASVDVRAKLLLKPHGRMEADGCARFRCPASGDAPTVICPLRPRDDAKSASLHNVKRAELPRKDERSGLCSSLGGTVTMKPGATYPRYFQELHFGSREWYETYTRMRQTVESFNNQVKDGAFTALASADRRRVRGFAAQQLCVAMILAAGNDRKIERWLQSPVQPDSEGRGPLSIRKLRRRDDVGYGPRGKRTGTVSVDARDREEAA